MQLRLVTRSLINKTKEPVGILQNFKKNDNRWHSIQLTRAREILKNNDIEQLTHDEIIQKYRTHIIHTLTPEPDVTDMNCIAQLRAQPFDLDAAYQQSELKAKTYLGTMLNDYNKRLAPNLEVIQEMVNIGNRKGSFKIHTYNNFILALDHMRKMPTNEDCENAKTFLSKINIIRQTKEAYEYGLHNMGDDFMLLRFGKIFGSNASTSTEMANKQFIYLVHLFIKSLSNFVLLTQETSNEIHPILSTIAMVTTNFVTLKPRSSFIRLDDEHLLSPEENVDRWTWLLEKWLDALRTFPIILTEVGAFGRLVRTTIGIGIARLFNFAETMIVNNNQTFDLAYLNEKLFHALQMGFYFGLAYAIVDCVQDEFRNLDKKSNDYLTALHFQPNSDDHELTPYELMEKWLLIMEKLLCGEEFNRSGIPKTPLTPLLLETFDGLITLTKDINITCSAFNELALLLRSQRIDKKTINEFYTDEDIFLGKTIIYLFCF